MKLHLDDPVHDLLTGQQVTIEGLPNTLRTLVIRACTTPDQDDPKDPVSAAQAWELGVRAASTPKDGDMELSVGEAAYLKTRAFKVLFIAFAGPIHSAIEAAAA